MFQPIIFKNHIRVRTEIDDERIWDVKSRWEKALAYVARDVPGFLAYLRDEMTEEELGWFSDVYEREFPVKLVPGYAESLYVACRRLPACARRLGVLEMLKRNGFVDPGPLQMTESPIEPEEPKVEAKEVVEEVPKALVKARRPSKRHRPRKRETC